MEKQHSAVLTTKPSKRHYQFDSGPGWEGRIGKREWSRGSVSGLGGIEEIQNKGHLLNRIILRVSLSGTGGM